MIEPNELESVSFRKTLRYCHITRRRSSNKMTFVISAILGAATAAYIPQHVLVRSGHTK